MPGPAVNVTGTVTGTFFTVALVSPYTASASWNEPFRLNENLTFPALVTPFLIVAFRANLLLPPLFALPCLLSTKLWVTPPTSTVTGKPSRLIPAAIWIFPFHAIVSWPVLLNLSVIVALWDLGCVILAKLMTCDSCCSLMQSKLGDGRDARLPASFLACLKFPCTVARVRMIAEPPAGIVGAYVTTACPTLFTPSWIGGERAPAPCTTKPTVGSV